jgi:enamine deaminase RidA (YjgF/YER057c/UK114 family)
MASDSSRGYVEHLNPEGLPQNPAFTNVVVVTGPVRTIYIGGQDAVDATGQIVGVGDIGAQTAQVFENMQTALEAAGAGLEHVVKWNILIVEGQPLEPGFAEFQRVWGERANPPVITAAFVSALANPEFLVEMDAIAVVPL